MFIVADTEDKSTSHTTLVLLDKSQSEGISIRRKEGLHEIKKEIRKTKMKISLYVAFTVIILVLYLVYLLVFYIAIRQKQSDYII